MLLGPRRCTSWPLAKDFLVLGMAASLLIGACASERGTIGAILARRPSGELTVRSVPPGLGSARAGLEPGDRILLVDGIDVRALSVAELRHLLAGLPGDTVRLTVIRGDAIVRMNVQRTPVPQQLDDDPLATP